MYLNVWWSKKYGMFRIEFKWNQQTSLQSISEYSNHVIVWCLELICWEIRPKIKISYGRQFRSSTYPRYEHVRWTDSSMQCPSVMHVFDVCSMLKTFLLIALPKVTSTTRLHYIPPPARVAYLFLQPKKKKYCTIQLLSSALRQKKSKKLNKNKNQKMRWISLVLISMDLFSSI